MAQAKRDENRVPTLLVTTNDGNATPVRALADPVTHRVLVDASGTVTSEPFQASSATTSNVAGSASNVTLLATNADRLGASIFNDSTATLYIKLGTTASTSSFTVFLRPYEVYELPLPIYTGQIDGIWTAANGAARITELE